MVKHCLHCGQPARGGERFCPTCGGSLDFEEQRLPGSGSAPLTLRPTQLSFGKLRMAATARREIRITNIGSDRLKVSVQSGIPWVQVIPGPYILGPGQSQAVFVQANTGKLLRIGKYAGELQFHSQAGTQRLVINLEITPPFILDPADLESSVASIIEIGRYCDKDWKTAVRLFQAGRLEACLVFLDEQPALNMFKTARAYTDPEIALEAFLQSLDPSRGRRPPVHNGNDIETRLGFGPRGRGVNAPPSKLGLIIRNPNKRGYLRGEAHPLVDWLKIVPGEFSLAPGKSARLMLHVNKSRWPRQGRDYSLGVDLYEIVTLTPDGETVHYIRKTSMPGILIWGSIGVLVLSLLIIIGILVGMIIVRM